MTEVQQQLIECIRCILKGTAIKKVLEKPEDVYTLAKNHDMAHFIGYAVDKRKLDISNTETQKIFRQEYLKAAKRVIILENDIKNIREVFEDSGIDFILLKGAVIRKLYPEQWMRVSGDIDILVRSEKLIEAEKVLVDRLQYTVTSEGAHHDHVTSPSGFHIDLHFILTEREERAKPLLDNVWNHSHLAEGKKHEYQMEDDMFYLFHMFHTGVHFKLGGCGIRSVLDTWLLNHRIPFDVEKRRNILQQAGLHKFAETVEKISEAWFSGTETDRYKDVEEYIFNGGLYGGKQRIAATQARNGGRFKYLISRAFPSVETMKYVGYPMIEKWKVLLPFFWIHRLVRGLAQGKGKLVPYEFQKTMDESARSREMAGLFISLGL